MEFRNNEAIYLQIAGYISENILVGKWHPDEKIPSVRELGTDLQVNPNTVMRTYEFLQNKEVIYNKRGIGFFVAPDAVKNIKLFRKERFLQHDLPDFFRSIYHLEIDLNEIGKLYQKFKSENFNSNGNENE